jgi:hypothetical protein
VFTAVPAGWYCLSALILTRRRQQAALRLAELMKAEDGIAATVDHIHRTVYTALLGKSCPLWMKPTKDAEKAGAPISSIQEVRERACVWWEGAWQRPTIDVHCSTSGVPHGTTLLRCLTRAQMGSCKAACASPAIIRGVVLIRRPRAWEPRQPQHAQQAQPGCSALVMCQSWK